MEIKLSLPHSQEYAHITVMYLKKTRVEMLSLQFCRPQWQRHSFIAYTTIL
jgi:hypothetical protein